ncbi:MAG TPA: Asp-tRNA(Asn)/Glu-tRNA(Gln) amidotransferase subunit GatB [Gemmatimonadaceae bacterium]|nr:Asp-tRNA(Asn)/Glu-tRNA(Gln) amidotransferase subunit GatB [Gemmatimonadaceae bacterium]
MTVAATDDVTTGFEMVVGLEVHVQLKTASKAFCGCSTDFGAPPNSNTCPVCLALPGALPVLNARAVELALRIALGFGFTVNPRSIFARKNYFYPDLPKGYQISQHDKPIAEHGSLDIGLMVKGVPRVIGITRAHMEEDAGKSIHDRFDGATAVDLNRSGVPLVEIVSEPDMRSPEEAGAYLRTLKQILLYLDVSDCNMEEGSLRVDANVSARPFGQQKLGTKCEVKNMNSFSGVEKALAAEFRRQCGVLRAGGTVQQQTLLWDGHKGEIRPARSKEGSSDYRYFPEPDLPPLVVSESELSRVRATLPELPAARRARYSALTLSEYDVQELTADPATGPYFESVLELHGDAKSVANWVTGELRATLNESGGTWSDVPVDPSRLAALLELVRDGVVSSSAAKKIYAALLTSADAPRVIAEREGLVQVRDDDALARWVAEVLAENPAEAARFAAGEKKLTGLLVGLVMKKSQGRADPKLVNQMLSTRAAG